jgi:hypothetical protein
MYLLYSFGSASQLRTTGAFYIELSEAGACCLKEESVRLIPLMHQTYHGFHD